jgi:hypothetical protein
VSLDREILREARRRRCRVERSDDFLRRLLEDRRRPLPPPPTPGSEPIPLAPPDVAAWMRRFDLSGADVVELLAADAEAEPLPMPGGSVSPPEPPAAPERRRPHDRGRTDEPGRGGSSVPEGGEARPAADPEPPLISPEVLEEAVRLAAADDPRMDGPETPRDATGGPRRAKDPRGGEAERARARGESIGDDPGPGPPPGGRGAAGAVLPPSVVDEAEALWREDAGAAEAAGAAEDPEQDEGPA